MKYICDVCNKPTPIKKAHIFEEYSHYEDGSDRSSEHAICNDCVLKLTEDERNSFVFIKHPKASLNKEVNL